MHDRITVDGKPLRDWISDTESAQIREHLKREQGAIALQCGARRPASSTLRTGSRPGRPHRAVSLVLLNRLEPFLLDESISLEDIALRFSISLNDVWFYKERLHIKRKRGPKKLEATTEKQKEANAHS